MQPNMRSLLDSDGDTLDKSALLVVDRAVRDQHPDAFEVLRNLVVKRGVNPSIRAALVSLARAFSKPDAEELMLSVLTDDESSVVRFRVCDVLMQIGSDRAFGALEQVAASASREVAVIARFARVVIAHRLGFPVRVIDDLALDVRKLPLVGPALSFESHPLSPQLYRDIVADLEEHPFRLGLYAPVGVEITCGAGRWILILHEHVVARGISEVLAAGPVVLGVIVRRSDEHKRWSVARLVLGGPLDDLRFYVAVFRRDGRLHVFGTGRIEERHVELSAASHPGAAAVIAQAYWHGSVLVVAGIAGTNRTPAQKPHPHLLQQEVNDSRH